MLKAFHNDPKVKEKYITRVKAHQIADEIVQGQYWEYGKGCAVGCTVHSSDHSSYENELGIPSWIARLQDKLFEGMANEDAKLFPLKFLEAIPVGVDLEKSKAPFLIFLLEIVLTDFDNKKYPEQAKAINNVIVLYKENCTDVNKWQKARDAAGDAGDAAWAARAARAAGDAGAAAAARAAGAAWAAAARDAAGAARDAARDARAAARRKRYKLLADKLLEIFKTLEES